MLQHVEKLRLAQAHHDRGSEGTVARATSKRFVCKKKDEEVGKG